MLEAEIPRAVDSATAAASALGLAVESAHVLHASNKLTLRLLPCDVVARVTVAADPAAQFEVQMAQRLAGPDSPVATLDPRVEPGVHARDGFAITFWTYYAPTGPPLVPPTEYARALMTLHTRMRAADVEAPHVMDRVDEARRLVASRDLTPDLADADRELLADTLRDMRRAIDGHRKADQLLHGEPHPGNVLPTRTGLVFIDLETCCRGPVEFDLAHAPPGVSEHYPGLDRELLRDCRLLMLAMITTWRWERDDQLPNGRQRAAGWLRKIRAMRDCERVRPPGRAEDAACRPDADLPHEPLVTKPVS